MHTECCRRTARWRCCKIPGTAPSFALTKRVSDRHLLGYTQAVVRNQSHCFKVSRTTIAHTNNKADPREPSTHNRDDVHKQVDAFPINEPANQYNIDCATNGRIESAHIHTDAGKVKHKSNKASYAAWVHTTPVFAGNLRDVSGTKVVGSSALGMVETWDGCRAARTTRFSRL
jgi:hypothetical protein